MSLIIEMLKIFYGMTNDIVEKSHGNNGLMDIFQKCNYTVYNEIAQIRGEKIDVAYVPYNEKVIGQLVEVGVKKISIFSMGTDSVTIPKGYIMVSSDKMSALKNCYNIVINHKAYITDIEFVIQGEDDPYTDVARNFYILFGNVITSTWMKFDIQLLKKNITTSNLPNIGNIYLHAHTTLEGLKKCTIKKYVVRVNACEYYSGIQQIIDYIRTNDKIVCNNVGFKKLSTIKFGISDNILAGKYDALVTIYYNTLNMLHNRLNDIRKKIRLEFNPCQILAMAHLIGKMDFIQASNDKYIKDIMCKHFNVIPIDDLGEVQIEYDKYLLTTPIEPTMYKKVCEIKQITDI